MEHALIAVATLAGVIGHILKKLIQVRETTPTMHLKDYLTTNPYKTAMVIFYAFGGVAGLYAMDSVSWYSALITGFAANSLSGKSD